MERPNESKVPTGHIKELVLFNSTFRQSRQVLNNLTGKYDLKLVEVEQSPKGLEMFRVISTQTEEGDTHER